MDNESNFENKGCINLGLRIGISIFALLYLIAAIDDYLPLNAPNSWNMENLALKILFIIFIVGFSISWKYEIAAGIIFIIWIIGMCYENLFLCTSDCGVGIAMGIPLLILSIFFIVYGRRKHIKHVQ